MYRAKATQVGESQLEELLEKLDAQTMDVISHRRSTVLHGLPLYMRETASISNTILVIYFEFYLNFYKHYCCKPKLKTSQRFTPVQLFQFLYEIVDCCPLFTVFHRTLMHWGRAQRA
ncbi:hypothetical protein PGIGA_G00012390 [Pangasianodon gigas]|uniref:Uncharacterized protein n=1 Tax=Pangasianodon gigas TaxID=30993 RepID=A0ACC5W785_PANGG|nr:hypothetical protein [Pangasianodon gigas]